MSVAWSDSSAAREPRAKSVMIGPSGPTWTAEVSREPLLNDPSCMRRTWSHVSIRRSSVRSLGSDLGQGGAGAP